MKGVCHWLLCVLSDSMEERVKVVSELLHFNRYSMPNISTNQGPRPDSPTICQDRTILSAVDQIEPPGIHKQCKIYGFFIFSAA